LPAADSREEGARARSLLPGIKAGLWPNQRLAKMEGGLKLLTWMIGFNLTTTIGVFFMLLRH
jgi:hypothetical protein